MNPCTKKKGGSFCESDKCCRLLLQISSFLRGQRSNAIWNQMQAVLEIYTHTEPWQTIGVNVAVDFYFYLYNSLNRKPIAKNCLILLFYSHHVSKIWNQVL